MSSTDRIFLFGPRACGKSTVGRALAQELRGWPFVDIDYEYLLLARVDGDAPREGNGTPPPRDYYADCRQLLLEHLTKPRGIFALSGGSLINEVAPEIGLRNLQDCRRHGRLVLVLPSRFDRRNRGIIAEREAKRHYALAAAHSTKHYNSRIEFFRNCADLTVCGTEPARLAKKIIRHYQLTS